MSTQKDKAEYIYSGMKLQYSKNIGEWLDKI